MDSNWTPIFAGPTDITFWVVNIDQIVLQWNPPCPMSYEPIRVIFCSKSPIFCDCHQHFTIFFCRNPLLLLRIWRSITPVADFEHCFLDWRFTWNWAPVIIHLRRSFPFHPAIGVAPGKPPPWPPWPPWPGAGAQGPGTHPAWCAGERNGGPGRCSEGGWTMDSLGWLGRDMRWENT